ncbi:hypothetical protein [Phytopseudomonas daroniae]|uniref:hypothetical protein n=1 Tax=Pseudomonadaceae TaxID=135621 RepID=UPI0013F168CB|nr:MULTISPECIES: hypothetical protein [Pseudomonas]
MHLILAAGRRSELARDQLQQSSLAVTAEGGFAAGSRQIAGKPGSYARWAEAELQRL